MQPLPQRTPGRVTKRVHMPPAQVIARVATAIRQWSPETSPRRDATPPPARGVTTPKANDQ